MGSKIWSAASALLLVGLVATNMVLQHRYHQAVSRIEYLQLSQAPTVGSTISNLSGTDINGARYVEDYSNRNDTSLLLVFSPACQYCQRNWPNWSRLVQEYSPSLNVVYADLSASVTSEYFKNFGVAVPSHLVKFNSLAAQEHSLFVTPTTLVVGPKGLVKYVHVGVLDDNMVEQIGQFLSEARSVK